MTDTDETKKDADSNNCPPQFSVEFAPPEHGWIDTAFKFGDEIVEYSFSNVYDPFYADITKWLETIGTTGQVTMKVDI
jgi:hypothetical protein